MLASPRIILVTSAIMVLIGIALSFYQAQYTVDNLSNQEQKLSIGHQMSISKDMDPKKNSNGIYSVQIMDYINTDKVKIVVTDPYENSIASKVITKNPFQDNFNISANGTYKLQIENDGNRDIQILGIIGYYPAGIETYDLIGLIVLLAGLSGLAVGMMYLIRNRRKSTS